MQALAALSTPPLRGRKNPAWKGPTKHSVNRAADRLCPTQSLAQHHPVSPRVLQEHSSASSLGWWANDPLV